MAAQARGEVRADRDLARSPALGLHDLARAVTRALHDDNASLVEPVAIDERSHDGRRGDAALSCAAVQVRDLVGRQPVRELIDRLTVYDTGRSERFLPP